MARCCCCCCCWPPLLSELAHLQSHAHTHTHRLTVVWRSCSFALPLRMCCLLAMMQLTNLSLPGPLKVIQRPSPPRSLSLSGSHTHTHACPCLSHPGTLTVRFQVYAPNVSPARRLYVTGDATWLGAWDTTAAVAMSAREYPLWAVSVTVPAEEAATALPLNYKCVQGKRGCPRIVC